MKTGVFRFLMSIVALHLFLDLEVFIGKSLANLLCFQSENGLECILFGAEHLDLALMEVELFG